MALRDKVKINEKIVAEVNISKKAIIVDWLAIPSVFVVFFLSVCLPVIIRTLTVNTAKAAFEQAIGIENAGFSDVAGNMWRAIMPNVPNAVLVFVQVLIWLLFIVWLIFALVRTKLHFGYEVILTDKRVLARARNAYFESEWQDVKNVFVGQSIWGRLLKYGSLTIQGARSSITVHHINNPKSVYAEFKIRTDTF